MSEWNYTECARPFESKEEALMFMINRDLAGFVLERTVGFTAVCPTYPEGFYADAKVVASLENTKGDLKNNSPSNTGCC